MAIIVLAQIKVDGYIGHLIIMPTHYKLLSYSQSQPVTSTPPQGIMVGIDKNVFNYYYFLSSIYDIDVWCHHEND